MRNLGLFAFGLTTCVLVPTALHVLRAGPEQVAKLVAPDTGSLTIGKAKIDVSVDRAIVDPGGKVHVTFTASAEQATRVSFEVLVLEALGSDGGRVENPPARLALETVTLDIKNGTATKTLAFTLPGFRGQLMDTRAEFGHYTVLVMPTASADKLERFRRRASNESNIMVDANGAYGSWWAAYNEATSAVAADNGEEPQAVNDGDPNLLAVARGQVARLDVTTRPKDSQVAIHMVDSARVGDEVPVIVTVTNPSQEALDRVSVKLESASSANLRAEYLGIPDADLEITPPLETDIAMKPHEIKDVLFHVRSRATGTLGLYAIARCDGDDCEDKSNARDVDDVALDALDITPAEAPKTTVVIK